MIQKGPFEKGPFSYLLCKVHFRQLLSISTEFNIKNIVDSTNVTIRLVSKLSDFVMLADINRLIRPSFL